MDRFRLRYGKLAAALLGCGLPLVALAQDRPLNGPPPAPPANTAPAPGPPIKPPTLNLVQPASLTSKPTIRAATGGIGGLPAPIGVITASVIARVNGQPILVEEVMNAAAGKLAEARIKVPPEQFAAVQAEVLAVELENIINREVILQDASIRIRGRGLEMLRDAANKEFDKTLRKRREQLGFKSNDELRVAMQKQGLSMDEERRQYERSFVAMEYIRNLIRTQIEAIDREQMLEYYRLNVKEFDKPERLVWQWLFVDIDNFTTPDPSDPKKFKQDFAAARRYAEMVHGKLQGVKSEEAFQALVEEHAHGRSKTNRGKGDGAARGEIRPTEVEAALFSLRPGQTGPIIQAPTGLHLIRVVEHTPGGKVSFEEACPEIKKRLQNKIGSAEYQRVLKELRAKAHIESAIATKP